VSSELETHLVEKRRFPPPADFQKHSRFKDPIAFNKIWEDSQKDPVGFWSQAATEIHWFKKWDTAFKWNAPFAKWFIGGTTNASYQCLDRHLGTPTENKVAFYWEGENGATRKLTYRDLYEEVCQLANALENKLGLKKGDRAAIYMPMTPEAIISMLACARLGVTHSVVFAGFSAQSLKDRILDANCKIVFTADVGYRRGQPLNLIQTVYDSISGVSGVEHVVCLGRESTPTQDPRTVDWTTLISDSPKTHTAAEIDSEHPLFFLYTSGTTGKPKGIVHSTGGYLVGTHRTASWVFDFNESDVYWCTADIGWVTGHSYMIYGILSNGVTSVFYEGAPTYPDPGRIWSIIDKYQVTILYTAPTAIRALMREGDDYPNRYSLASLRLLGSVGEPINPEAWIWYHHVIGHDRCPIVDTWWQTETGAIMIAPIPGVTDLKPGSATRPFPGILVDIVDDNGNSCPPNIGGNLVITHPWPSMLRTIHGDPERYQKQYWATFPNIYFTADGAHRDDEGYYWIMGRIDDVINVSGHRLGTMEIESALVSHPMVAEAAVVGRPNEIKGQAIVAYVTPMDIKGLDISKLESELKQHITKEIGGLARPDEIKFTKFLPKTRSGKIMRRLLKDLAAGKTASGDTSTLENPGLVEFIEP